MAENTGPGHKFIERGAHKGKGIAVFTSGGDSQVCFDSIDIFDCSCKHVYSFNECINNNISNWRIIWYFRAWMQLYEQLWGWEFI